jgi:hypothetical protein
MAMQIEPLLFFVIFVLVLWIHRVYYGASCILTVQGGAVLSTRRFDALPRT